MHKFFEVLLIRCFGRCTEHGSYQRTEAEQENNTEWKQRLGTVEKRQIYMGLLRTSCNFWTLPKHLFQNLWRNLYFWRRDWLGRSHWWDVKNLKKVWLRMSQRSFTIESEENFNKEGPISRKLRDKRPKIKDNIFSISDLKGKFFPR